LLAILNVGRRTVPFHALPSLVPQWHGAGQKPPILPVGAPDAHLLLERITAGNARAQSSHNSIQIFGMNSTFPAFLRFSQLRLAGILSPASIPKLNGSVGSSDPRHRWNGLNGFAKFSFLPPQLLHSESMQSPKECQKHSHARQAEPVSLIVGWGDLQCDRSFRPVPLPLAVAGDEPESIGTGPKIRVNGFSRCNRRATPP